ncbi:MAG: hypothetical protein KDA61_03305 [Planctomycetales bacterium]|nr:hypothetical protein [Planctomycetales bacterium]
MRSKPQGRAAKWIVLACVLLAAPFVWGVAFRGEYATRQAAAREFVLDEDFTVVRKILVRKNAAQQIVTMSGDSEFVEQKFSSVGGDVNSLELLNPQWRLELEGTLRVRILDKYVGQQVVALDQDIEITVDKVDSQVELREPSERLKDYAMTTRFTRTPENKTLIELSLEQAILTDAPWFAHGIADRRVKASVEKSLENQEEAIRQVIAENRDDVPLLPLR